MSKPTPHLFDRPYWKVFSAIGWIRDRSRDKFGELSDLHDFRATIFYRPPRLNPWKAARVLIDALQSGSIQASKNGRLLPPEYWDDEKLVTSSGLYQLSAGVLVPSAHVRGLRLPKQPRKTSKAKTGKAPDERNKAAQNMREALKTGKFTPEALGKMGQVALALEFCGKDTARETACKARDIVLREVSSAAITGQQ